MAMILVAILDN